MQKSGMVAFMNNALIALLALVLAEIAFMARTIKTDSQQHAEVFQEALLDQERKISYHLEEFAAQYLAAETAKRFNPDQLKKLKELHEQKGIILLVYKNNNLEFWSSNALPLNHYRPPETEAGAVQKQNGWYYFQKTSSDDYDIVAYFIVKQQYRYQNRFLVNEFHDRLPAVQELFYISDRADLGHSILDSNGNYLFSLVLRREAALYKPNAVVYVLALLAAMAAWGFFIYNAFRYFSRLFKAGKRHFATAGFVSALLLVRIITFWLKLPSVFYNGYMFSPELYATAAWLPSLGDLVLNVTLLTAIAYFLFSNLRNIRTSRPPRLTLRLLAGFVLIALIWLISGATLYLIESLVINSRLNLDVNFIFKLDVYSMMGFIAIGLICFAFYFFSIVICRIARSFFIRPERFWTMCVSSLLVLIAISWVVFGANLLLWMLLISAPVVYELDRRSSLYETGFSALAISVFIFSLISSAALYKFNAEKDLETRKTLILQLASEQDPVAEFLFKEIEETLFNDNQLQNLVKTDPYNISAITNYLQHHYFYDFWAKYELQITVCMPDENLLIKPANVEVPCAVFFDDYISGLGKPTISGNFIYLDNNTGRKSYITMLTTGRPDGDGTQQEFHIYIEFDSKFIARDMGFPELLIDDAVDINRELINYSYATYKDGMLVNEFGPYVYALNSWPYEVNGEEFTVFEKNRYIHLAYQKDDETLIIISRPRPSFLEALAPFSYLFITFFVLAAVFWLLVNRTRPRHLLKMNFVRRVQYSMIIILLLAALSIGGVSALFLFNIYENKNLAFLNEKTHSVLREIEDHLVYEDYLDHNMRYYLQDLLLQYSNVFFSDINLYSTDGLLIASSRPKIFEEGLVGQKMNTLAFHHMLREEKSQFIHSEHIGKLEYLSAYTPVYNQYNEKLAYLNLPYFAKQSELRNEVSYFLVAFINIYLLLVLLAVILALFVSNYVTKPLQLLREKLARIQLGKTNEIISWSRDDEIGALINEYNRMIDELSVSADLLARSERETAWREMARQVAHEIKNPLTPMKLSVQYLEKAWKEKEPDWDERLARFSKTMIEQIDNLATIAKEFSDFAQMPAGKNDVIDLKEFVPEALDLYKDFEKMNITLTMEQTQAPMLVNADRQQLLRVFNNLIKNAMQAYDKNQIPRIEVHCVSRDTYYSISVVDFGCGIPDHQKQNIFNPYYTTKAKGMGLGLSIVKNIVESLSGTISFTSKEGEGSRFEFSLPRKG
ncbi:MAG: ATP-binding protein [Bacteroidales bacterium]|nr:ATP-binding protein [Bacteroidales bacterium]